MKDFEWAVELEVSLGGLNYVLGEARGFAVDGRARSQPRPLMLLCVSSIVCLVAAQAPLRLGLLGAASHSDAAGVFFDFMDTDGDEIVSMLEFEASLRWGARRPRPLGRQSQWRRPSQRPARPLRTARSLAACRPRELSRMRV